MNTICLSKVAVASVAALVCIVLSAPLAVAQDTTPPALTDFTFSPIVVNTTSSSATVDVTAHVTDNLSGVQSVVVYFESPSLQHGTSGIMTLSSGTIINGTWTASITFPQYGEPGMYVCRLETSDKLGNVRYYSSSDLQSLGSPTALQVLSNQDTTAPVLTSFSFIPTVANTISSSATVNAIIQATDDLSGIQYVSVRFTSPSGQHNVSGLLTGSDLSGTLIVSLVFPRYGEAGLYLAEVEIGDKIGNVRKYSAGDLTGLSFPSTLQVVSNQDTTPPALRWFTFSPPVVDITNGPATVNVTARATDDLSGVQYVVVYFDSPSLQQGTSGFLQLTSGTDQDGVFTGSITFPQYGELGTHLAHVEVGDKSGNVQKYSAKDLFVRWFPAALRVIANRDKTPPVILGLPGPGCTIWPPNHKLVQVATVRAEDAESGIAPGSFQVFGTASAPTDGSIVITGGPRQFTVLLRADKGMIYTLKATATDLAGNTVIKQATCVVPQDMRK